MENQDRKQDDYKMLLEAECTLAEERTKLLKNLGVARKNFEEVHVLNNKIVPVFYEIELTMRDVRSIKMQLNRAAREFGLSPIPIRRVKPTREVQPKQASKIVFM